MTKQQLEDLAIFGGAPAFAEKLYVGRPNIGDQERFFDRVRDIFDRRWLTNNGPYVQEFEQQVASMSGVKHCVAMCNATVALEIAIRALGLCGEVIVPSFTFIATAHCLQWQEITPVFCDIDPETHNLDPARVEQMITPRTSGIIGVHLWGRSCATEALANIANRHNLKLLFDAGHALGCSSKGKMIGGFGHAEVFSFHATKFVNSFEGGAVVTDDHELAEKMRLMKNFGFADYDQVDFLGTNGKMSEVCAAMGLTTMASIDEFIAVNHDNYRQYLSELKGVPGISVVMYDEQERNNYQYAVLEIDEAVTGVSRDQLIQILWAENVLARRYFYPGCHRMEPYRSLFPLAGRMLPATERLAQRVLVLPNGTSIDTAAVQEVCGIIKVAVENNAALQVRLSDGIRARGTA